MRKKVIKTNKEGFDALNEKVDKLLEIQGQQLEILTGVRDFILEVTVNDANEKIEELSTDDSN